MPYVEHVDHDIGESSNGLWIILGVVIVILVFMLMLAWTGVFGTQVQQVIPFYSAQPAPAPTQAVPGETGAPGAAGAPGAPGAPAAPAPSSPTTP